MGFIQRYCHMSFWFYVFVSFKGTLVDSSLSGDRNQTGLLM